MHFQAFILSVILGLVVGDDEPTPSYNYPAASNGLAHGQPFRSQLNSIDEDPISILARNIPGDGVPGLDFPILSHVPDTGFDCKKQSSSGYFADIDEQALCQVFHICQEDGTIDSFLCPNGSIFNQQYFVCDWWFNVDCSESEQYFRLNQEIGVIPEESQAIGRFDSPSLGYSAGISDSQGRNFLTQRSESGNKKQETVIQQERSSLESSEDTLLHGSSALNGGYQTPKRRDSSVNNLYQVPELRGLPPKQSYQAPEQREDITISQEYLSPQIRKLPAPEQREDITISQEYQSPQIRNTTVNQWYETPTLRDEGSLPQTYGTPLQNRRN